MELKEREEIIKALECCSVWENCDGCPYRNSVALGYTSKMMRAALALIKELTEENERLQDLITEVQQYNEAWVEDNGKLRKAMKTLKVDTVRKMQELTKVNLDKYGNELDGYSIVYQTAKELLEENNV